MQPYITQDVYGKMGHEIINLEPCLLQDNGF